MLMWEHPIGQLVTTLLLHQIKLWWASKLWRYPQDIPYHGAQTQGSKKQGIGKKNENGWVQQVKTVY